MKTILAITLPIIALLLLFVLAYLHGWAPVRGILALTTLVCSVIALVLQVIKPRPEQAWGRWGK